MDFYQKYELIDPLAGAGTRSFRARQKATGRDVSVHLLTGGRSPESEALLTRLRNLPPASLSKLIEVGENEGTTFVATVAPPFQHLEEWLAEQERAASEGPQLTRAGMWKVPVTPPAGPPQPPAAAPVAAEPGEFTKMFRQGAPPAPASEPGEFTRQFQAAQQADRPQMEARPASPPPSPPAAPAGQPGEFTRMFQSAQQGEAPPAQALPQAPPAQESRVSGPGEFTRLFKASQAAQTPETPLAAPPQPGAGGPGEFTKMFHSPLPAAPAQGDWPPQAPKPAEPGEFTRMFQSPAPAAAPAEPARQGGEFTRFFAGSGPPQGPTMPAAAGLQAALPQPPAPSQPTGKPGEFTQMFGQPGFASEPPPSPPPPAQQPRATPYGGGGATQAFSIPQAPAPAAAPQGPSEYTRMMQAQAPPQAPPPAAGAPGMVPLGAPQLQYTPPQAPQLQVTPPQAPQLQYAPPPVPQYVPPQAPQIAYTPPQAPQLGGVAVPAKAPVNWLLIAIIGLVTFIAGAVIVLLLVKK